MSRYLFIDIGAGTMDILHYDTRSDIYCKAVARSPVRGVAEKAASLPGNLLVVGTEMGGGNLAQVLREKARVSKVVMSLSASATVSHDPEKVEVMVATGPRRSLVEGSRFPLVRGSPLGDNMMTGTVGLLEALSRKEGLAPFPKV